jgi:sulfhydrogenase subunit alpha
MTAAEIRIDALSRVEGGGGILVRMTDGAVDDVRVRIFEPPRFFEGLLRGRHFTEVPDITSRICGICPVAYQVTSAQALEDACGVAVDGPLRDLRRLIYCGEWIESHALHIHMLHAPDFLGYPDAIRLAKDHPAEVRRGLGIKQAGNRIIASIGGREIHPINVRVGGFYALPSVAGLRRLGDTLKRALDDAVETVRWVAGFPRPVFERDYRFVSLAHPTLYPIGEGRIVSSGRLDIPAAEYEAAFAEAQVPHSTALHSRIAGEGAYVVGPLARLNLNFDRLPPRARESAADAGIVVPCRNPFLGIVARAVETVAALEEAVRLVESYVAPPAAAVDLNPVPATGHWCTEAPRGLLYHRYAIDGTGLVADAKIVAPTSQNLLSIEEDLRQLASTYANLSEDELARRCEQAVRNYDPCISCATHSLKLKLVRN